MAVQPVIWIRLLFISLLLFFKLFNLMLVWRLLLLLLLPLLEF
jgi:hypothetical protein